MTSRLDITVILVMVMSYAVTVVQKFITEVGHRNRKLLTNGTGEPMMMEFYSESKHKSRKKRFCELCGRVINVGDYYYSERGKFEGEFFSRDMHVHCHNMELEFCDKVDNEFSWEDITEYILDNYCWNCESREECDCRPTKCPKIIKQFSDKEG